MMIRVASVGVVLIVFSMVTVSHVAGQDADEQPMNVLFLLVDDMGWTGPSCFGGDLHETPNIDRLVASGTKFTNAYAACAVCSPSRAAVLTGKYPARLHTTDWIPGAPTKHKLRIPDWKPYLDHAEVTIAEALKEAGYHTASVGKWHLGDEPYYPQTHGFDVNVAGTHFHSPPKDGGRYFLPNSLFPEAPKGEFLTDRLTTEALSLIEKWRDEPFFLYLPYYAVHDPVMGKDEYVEYFADKYQPGMRQFKPEYAALTRSVDDSVGRLMDALEKLGLTDRTLIIFTSDNGGQLDHTVNTPLRDGKASCYDGGVRVPAAVRWPGITRPGSVSPEPICGVDFYPTILEILDVPGDPTHNEEVDGVSLVEVLKSPESARLDRPLFWHYPHYNPQRRTEPYGAMRDGDWRLLVHYVDMRVELYNLKDDVGETRNLAESHPEKRRAMLRRFHAWLDEVGAQMPTDDPDYVPGTAPIWPWSPPRSATEPLDLSDAMARFAPQWTVSNCGAGMNPGIRAEWGGRRNVLVTHPRSAARPCVLKRTLRVPSDGKTQLVLDVAHDPRGDWTLVVLADDDVLAEGDVSRETAPNVWRTVRVDLTPLAGRTVTLKLRNQASGWRYEAAFWSRIAVEHVAP